MNKKLLIISLVLGSFVNIHSAAGGAGPAQPNPEDLYCFRTLTPPPYELEQDEDNKWLHDPDNFPAFIEQLTNLECIHQSGSVYRQASWAMQNQNHSLARGLLQDLYNRIWFKGKILQSVLVHKKWTREDIPLLDHLYNTADFYYGLCMPVNFGQSLMTYGIIDTLSELDDFRITLNFIANSFEAKRNLFENSMIQIPVSCLVCRKEDNIQVRFKDRNMYYQMVCFGECTRKRQEDAEFLASFISDPE